MKEKMIPEIRFEGFTDTWEQRKLGEILQIIDGDRGKNYPSSDDFLELGHTLFLSASNVTKRGFKFVNNQYISEEKSNSMGNGKVKMNDIILTSRGSIGNLALYNSDSGNKFKFLRINSGMLILRPDKFTQSSFILQSLNSQSGEKQIKLISFGSAQPQLTKKDVSNFQIQIPSAGEQIKIGDFFKQLDETITLQERKVNLLKEQKKGYLQKMFPKQNEKFPELRFEGFTDAWEQRKLGEILIERNEQTPESEEYPLMSFVQGVGVTPKGDRYDRSFLVKDEQKKYKRTQLGDFIYSSNNLETGSIGFNNLGNAVISPVYSIFYSENDISSKFIGIYSTKKDFINKMIKFRQGVVYGQWRIHEKDFLNIDLFIPCEKEQTGILNFFTKIDDAIALQERKLETLKELKKGYLQKMFA